LISLLNKKGNDLKLFHSEPSVMMITLLIKINLEKINIYLDIKKMKIGIILKLLDFGVKIFYGIKQLFLILLKILKTNSKLTLLIKYLNDDM